LGTFGELAGVEQKSLISRYRLLDVLLKKLQGIRTSLEEGLGERSPIQQYPDAEKNLVERWEDELSAAIEAEYRRHRSDLLGVLQWWLRDVWLRTLSKSPAANPAGSSPVSSALGSLLRFPELDATGRVASRLSPAQALNNLQTLEQLQRWLGSNVQEALALEVGLLKLHL
jgi:hypothetical protein